MESTYVSPPEYKEIELNEIELNDQMTNRYTIKKTKTLIYLIIILWQFLTFGVNIASIVLLIKFQYDNYISFMVLSLLSLAIKIIVSTVGPLYIIENGIKVNKTSALMYDIFWLAFDTMILILAIY